MNQILIENVDFEDYRLSYRTYVRLLALLMHGALLSLTRTYHMIQIFGRDSYS